MLRKDVKLMQRWKQIMVILRILIWLRWYRRRKWMPIGSKYLTLVYLIWQTGVILYQTRYQMRKPVYLKLFLLLVRWEKFFKTSSEKFVRQIIEYLLKSSISHTISRRYILRNFQMLFTIQWIRYNFRGLWVVKRAKNYIDS